MDSILWAHRLVRLRKPLKEPGKDPLIVFMLRSLHAQKKRGTLWPPSMGPPPPSCPVVLDRSNQSVVFLFSACLDRVEAQGTAARGGERPNEEARGPQGPMRTQEDLKAARICFPWQRTEDRRQEAWQGKAAGAGGGGGGGGVRGGGGVLQVRQSSQGS